VQVIMAPSERIKCLLQIQGEQMQKVMSVKYNGTLDCARQLLREGGMRSLFRGWQATLLRDIPG
jgi:solute carrier family 25 carnitine/acylcarnitine transporter 20/29